MFHKWSTRGFLATKSQKGGCRHSPYQHKRSIGPSSWDNLRRRFQRWSFLARPLPAWTPSARTWTRGRRAASAPSSAGRAEEWTWWRKTRFKLRHLSRAQDVLTRTTFSSSHATSRDKIIWRTFVHNIKLNCQRRDSDPSITASIAIRHRKKQQLEIFHLGGLYYLNGGSTGPNKADSYGDRSSRVA